MFISKMRLYYPKSFLKLVLVGLMLVALPMLVVLLSVVVSVEHLARQSQTAVQQAAHATRASRQMSELITAMERNARQFAILGDRSLIESYATYRARLAQTVDFLSGLVPDPEQGGALVRLTEVERKIFATLSDRSASKGAVTEAVSRYAELANLAQSIATRSNDRIADETDALRRAGDDVRTMVLWELAALFPAMIILVAGSTLMVARPIGEIDGAIRRMGSGDFTTIVSVGGPDDLRHLGQQLDWLRGRIVELEQQRNRFLQHVSHELKTPLTALREGSELLVGGMVGGLNAEQQDIAEILRQHSLHLQRLIEDLLNYAALRASRLELTWSTVNLQEVFDRAITAQRVALRTKELQLVADIPPVKVSGDAEKLLIVFDNLLSNAIKFSPVGGEITVAVSSSREHVVLDIIDCGPGVTVKDKDRVFDAFYRGSSARDSQVKGTGLGLAIVKEYVLAHGGTVTVVDTGNRGGHLRVVLPATIGNTVSA